MKRVLASFVPYLPNTFVTRNYFYLIGQYILIRFNYDSNSITNK